MTVFHTVHIYLDSFFIYFYRLNSEPILGYYIGTFTLCLICVILGEITASLVFKFNQSYIEQDNRTMIKMHNLSLYALKAKDKTSFKACNEEANEAFGKVFFTQITLALSSLWPVPFAIAWMETRFGEVPFALPFRIFLIGDSVGYLFTFIPIYILTRLLFGRAQHWFPFFKKNKKLFDSSAEESEKLLSFADVMCEERKETY